MNINFVFSYGLQEQLISFFGSVPIKENQTLLSVDVLGKVLTGGSEAAKKLNAVFHGMSDCTETETVPENTPSYHVFESVEAFEKTGAQLIADKITIFLKDSAEKNLKIAELK